MACTEPRLTALKLEFKGEIHRLRVDLSVFQLTNLKKLFCDTFQLQPDSFVIQYKDAEGDCLNVSSQEEYLEACRVFLNGADAIKAIRFSAVSRRALAFQEHVADPILKAIEKLVESLNATMEKVKQEEWAQRAQSKVERTNVAIKEAASTVAFEARESFNLARQSLNEIPFEKILKETADGLKLAADNISSFAGEVVGELKTMSKPAMSTSTEGESAPATETTEHVAPEPKEVVEVDDTVSVPPANDGEWEEVAEQPSSAAMEEVEVIEVEEAAPAVSEEEMKWAVELCLIRDILPLVSTSRAIFHLENACGDLQVALNALMEES